MTGLSIDTESLPDETHGFTLARDLDYATAPTLRRRLQRALDEGARSIVLDLSALEILDSSGLAVIVETHLRLRSTGGELAIMCDNSHTNELFRRTGLDQLLSIDCGANSSNSDHARMR